MAIAKAAGGAFFEALSAAITAHDVDYSAITAYLKETLSVKGKQLFQPLRVGLTGQLHGPELGPILALLGKDAALKRIDQLGKQLAC